ncbi:MAG: integrin alpha [Pirellulaceae bacterium]|nr:integrin alpha [Pirellulaceae bacterium]
MRRLGVVRHSIQQLRRARVRRLVVESLEDRHLMAMIDLAMLTAAHGTIIYGADAGDFSGISVSSAGDVNGDGFDDMIIGASNADAYGKAVGRNKRTSEPTSL